MLAALLGAECIAEPVTTEVVSVLPVSQPIEIGTKTEVTATATSFSRRSSFSADQPRWASSTVPFQLTGR